MTVETIIIFALNVVLFFAAGFIIGRVVGAKKVLDDLESEEEE